ncbi:MAG TPA: hypothetical protein VFV19_07750 [Candidatus Polarisedimenticolaceae bacterium]|nr:hypothetical protein [Candidatus Polarisedimenticolaceae bacterium]
MFATAALLLAVNAATFQWPVAEGWKSETMSFPLEFAKDLPYQGVEELRFSPGMFKPDDDGFFSYAFVWWLDGHPPLDQTELQDDLTRYFAGLSTDVGKEKGFTIDPKSTSASVKVSSKEQAKRGHAVHTYTGTVKTYDAFVTGKPITLNVEIWVWDCNEAGKRAALVLVSPKQRSVPIWGALEKRRNEFVCH